MRISKLKLKNYVCFYDREADDVEFGPGVNFIVGKNNSGKTALIDALTPGRSRAAHRSIQTVQKRESRPSAHVQFDIEFAFQDGEVPTILREHDAIAYIGISKSESAEGIPLVRRLLKLLSGNCLIRIKNNPQRANLGKSTLEFHFRVNRSEHQVYYFKTLNDFTIDLDSVERYRHHFDQLQTCWDIIIRHLNSNTYRFDAERLVEEHSIIANSLVLNPDASNLAQVMDTARREKTHQYNRLVRMVKYVYPEIREIVIRKFSKWSNEEQEEKEYFEIYIGYYDPAEQREDLRVPLFGCGTGVAQVMAMLYVVAVSEGSRIILIDEPHSFLHPEALRKLLAIFQWREYAHHQYILTTHSSTAIASVREKTILHVKRNGMQSTVRGLNANDTHLLAETLRSLGLRLSDFLGVDAIVWVEGPTEKRCFPLILEKYGYQLEGVRFIPIAEIGDPFGKSAKKFMKLLEEVSKDVGLLPREVICLCDGDKSNGLVHAQTKRNVRTETIPRQNFESYFLGLPEVLGEVMERDKSDDSKYREGIKARDWLLAKTNGKAIDDKTWLKSVDGAKLLDNMFNELAGISYDSYKVAYGEEITEKILETEQDHFHDIVKLIEPVLPEWSRPSQSSESK